MGGQVNVAYVVVPPERNRNNNALQTGSTLTNSVRHLWPHARTHTHTHTITTFNQHEKNKAVCKNIHTCCRRHCSWEVARSIFHYTNKRDHLPCHCWLHISHLLIVGMRVFWLHEDSATKPFLFDGLSELCMLPCSRYKHRGRMMKNLDLMFFLRF